MAVTKIDGGRQIKAASITNTEIAASAAIATSKLADGAEFLKRDGSIALTANLNANNNKITGLATPTAAGDAANKSYVDALANGLDWKASVRLVTSAPLPANTAAGSGVGKTLTADANGALTVDGVAVAVGNRILVKDETPASDNGIYIVTATGDGSNPYVLTRATDADENAEVTSGMAVFAEEGSANNDGGFVLTTANPITVDTTALTFVQFTGAASIIAGDGLLKTGNTLDVRPGDGIEIAADLVTVKLDSTTLSKSGAGLKVSSGGITGTELNTSVAGNGLTGGGGSALSVNVGDGIEIVSDAVKAKIDGSSLLLGGLGLKVNQAKWITREIPSSSINGSNVTFTLANTPTIGSEHVYLNGVLQNAGGGNDYTISGATITFNTAPLTGDVLLVSYMIP